MQLATRTMQAVIDLAILSLAYWAAFLLRFEIHIPLVMLKRLLFTWPYVVAFEFAVLNLFQIPRFSWRHMGLRESIRVLWATGSVTVVLLVLRIISGVVQDWWAYAQYALVPIGVIGGNFGFSLAGVVGVRLVRRVGVEKSSLQRLNRSTHESVRTLLVGAGGAGALVAREIEKRPDLGIVAVGFLDDDRSKQGLIVQGLRVLGHIDEITKIAEKTKAQQILVTIADMPPKALRQILNHCENARLPAKILPGLYQVIDGTTGFDRIRDVSIEDLLGRESVSLDMDLVGSLLRGKRILVTGAGGSIGSELCRQLARFGIECLVLVERSEYALFTIQQELIALFPELDIRARICDVSDERRLETVFTQDQPHTVFHAAAHKHVPMMEGNPGEAVKNNLFGTKILADVCDRCGCETFVMISTDKAVNPTSIMGATKRVAELYVQAKSSRSRTKYVAVRFGNVLGSTGSVVPTFKAQIAAGGPVTVTHPEMQRYFMTIPEASQLVLQAAAMGQGGEIFVLDMGSPVKIMDLAYDMIRLSGLVPDVDIKVEVTGMRPGEKLFEELGFDEEHMTMTAHPKIFIGKLASVSLEMLNGALAEIEPIREETDAHRVREVLQRLVPEMQLNSTAPASGETRHTGISGGLPIATQSC